MTVTEGKKEARPFHYEMKAMRTKVYRVLYGHAEGADPQGLPELNDRRKLDEGWNYIRAEEVFHSNASTKDAKGNLVSNGLFPPRRYRELLERLAVLRKFRSRQATV